MNEEEIKTKGNLMMKFKNLRGFYLELDQMVLKIKLEINAYKEMQLLLGHHLNQEMETEEELAFVSISV